MTDLDQTLGWPTLGRWGKMTVLFVLNDVYIREKWEEEEAAAITHMKAN